MKQSIDTRELPSGKILHTDVAIIGGGAAGLTVANSLANKNYTVSLFEAGGHNADEATIALHRTVNIGRPYPLLQNSRTFGLGGTTKLWGGHCLPISPFCFDNRSWIPHSEWPITTDKLTPFYKKGHALLGLGDFDYNPENIAKKLDKSLLPFLNNKVQTNIGRYRPISYAELLSPLLNKAPNLRTYLFANAIKILANENGKNISGIRLKTVANNEIIVKADYYILALGGIENARLLLDSRNTFSKGVGNTNDLVGRFFMEHIWYSKGNISINDSDKINDLYTRVHQLKGKLGVRGHLSLSPEILEKYNIPEFRAELVPVGMENLTDTPLSARSKLEMLSLPKELALHTQHIRRTPGVNAQLQRKDFKGYRLMNYVEQVPNYASRITLSHQKNQFGGNLAEVNWKLSAMDVKGIRVGHQIIKNEVKERNIGDFFYENGAVDENLDGADGGGHHMGTTRMSDTALKGVVDANCKVFGIDNLFIAGSSVFPSAGFSNPTLTITALSIRLAEYVHSLIR